MCKGFLQRKMFSLLGNCYSSKKKSGSGSRNVTLIILGFDNAGKTTTVRDLQGEKKDDVTPSLGFANASLKFGRLNITLFDVGGGPTIRDIWSSYYADVHGFIYVVDSTDSKRLQEMAENLRTVMMEPMLQGKPCLILANKQDKDGALTENEIGNLLNLESLAIQSKCLCRLELCSALSNATTSNKSNKQTSPIKDGFKWIVENVLEDWETLDERVAHDMEVQKQKAFEEHKAKAERIRKMREERERKEKEKQRLEAMNGEGSIHKKLPPIHSQHLPQQSQVVNSNEGASDAALSMNEERMKQFAQVMQQVGNDLNNSLSESLRSNRSMTRSPLPKGNSSLNHKIVSSQDEKCSDLDRTTETVTTNSGQSARVENMFVVDGKENESNNRLFLVDGINRRAQDDVYHTDNHRQLPPLNEEAMAKAKKKKKKVRKNQLEPFSPDGDTNHTAAFTKDAPNLAVQATTALKHRDKKEKQQEQDIGKVVLESYNVTESDFYDSDFVSDANNAEHQM
ncbi:uncharacterized protein LOC142341461 [Convolutriloba macropyga]|uniref:uncharacterized protein LOC142341461 n=1 Tax=Convolutriloba macropyga TaxID=536237 RepID=UPI003F525C88